MDGGGAVATTREGNHAVRIRVKEGLKFAWRGEGRGEEGREARACVDGTVCIYLACSWQQQASKNLI